MSNDARIKRRIEAEENAALDFQYEIIDALRSSGLSKEQLAQRLGVSKARVSQMFAAGANPTVKQMARICDALDRRFSFTAEPIEATFLEQFFARAATARQNRAGSHGAGWTRRSVANENDVHDDSMAA